MAATRVVLLWWTLVVVTARPVVACSLGGSIVNRVECDLTGSPYTVTQDVVVQKGATLVLKPGVTLQFDPGVGITVKGVLEAEVRFQAGCGLSSPSGMWGFKPGAVGRADWLAHLQLHLPRPISFLTILLVCPYHIRVTQEDMCGGLAERGINRVSFGMSQI